MKKWIIMGALAAVACLAGCDAGAQNTQAQPSGVQNQQEVSGQQQSQQSQAPSLPADGGQPAAVASTPVSQTQPVVSSPANQTPPSGNATTANPSTLQGYRDTVSGLSTETTQMVEKLNNAQPPNDFSSRQNQFFALKQEAKQLESRIDLLDDQAEMSYKTGQITYQDYRDLEYQLDALDHQLDGAMDSLEFRFGIDD